MQFEKPCIIVYKNFCFLNGNPNDTSFSDDCEHNLFSDDDQKTLKKKILKFSLSGSRGNGTLEEHKKLGGDVAVDVACRYLKYFLKDDKKLEEKITGFGKGEISCGEIKLVFLEIINPICENIRKNKTEEDLEKEIFL